MEKKTKQKKIRYGVVGLGNIAQMAAMNPSKAGN